MPDLLELDLDDTGISEWPAGLFEHDRDARFNLLLRGNPITTLPDVVMGGDEAFVIATARLDPSTLDAESRSLMDEYKRSVGIDPNRTYPPKGEVDFWIDDLDDDNKLKFKTIWDDLEDELDSQGFFEVIKKLEPPEFFEDSKMSCAMHRTPPF